MSDSSQDKFAEILIGHGGAASTALAKAMSDGRSLTVQQRLELALRMIRRSQWPKYFGRSEKQLKRYLDGADVPLSVITAIAEATGVSTDWITSGRPSADVVKPSAAPVSSKSSDVAYGSSVKGRYPAPSVTKEPVTMPRKVVTGPSRYLAISKDNFDRRLHPGLIGHPQVTEDIAFRKDFLENKLHLDVENLLLVEVRGDSMEPLIPNGSIVAVNLIVDQPPENGEFYVLHVEDELLVRRLELRLDGSLILHSENRRYAPDPIDRGRFKEVVLGKVEMWTVPRKQSKRTA